MGAGGYCASVSPCNLQVRGCWRVLWFCESRQSSGSWVLAGTVSPCNLFESMQSIFKFVGAGGYCASVSPCNLQGSWVLAGTVPL